LYGRLNIESQSYILMRLPATFFLSLLLLFLSYTAVQAADDDERWFQIELLIFENIDTESDFEGSANEIWPDNPGSPNYDNTIELLPTRATQDKVTPTHSAEEGIDVLALEHSFNTAPAINNPASEKILIDTVTTIDLLPAAENPDALPSTNTPAASDSNVQQIPQPAAIVPFQILPANELQLLEIKNKQIAENRYRPLLHIGWRQAVLSRELAKAIIIDKKILSAKEILNQSIPDLNLDSLSQPPSFIIADSTLLPSPLKKINQENHEELANYSEKLEGTIKITLERYLHINLDLIYQKDAEEENIFSFFNFNKKNSASVFRMTQKRRLRSKELHYFDHPRFGVLALITPYELPEPEKNLEQSQSQEKTTAINGQN